ncbi:endolytic transglycosylase MltG [Devosia sp.]|uniref:endolytic transglycosylase MltG n=1 Tax=Devosia sp. TaxID=1871048 RepID=UPI002F1AC461
MSKSDRKAKRTRRRSGVLEITNALLSLLVLGLIVLGGLLIYGASRFYAPAVPQEAAFTVERGSSVMTTARRLEEQGLIPRDQLLPSEWLFWAGTRALQKEKDIKAGEYLLPAGASMAAILREITEGTPIARRVTVPEGWTSWQVAQEIGKDAHVLVGDLAGVPPEGSILPGSYDYNREDTRQSVLDQMQARMQEEVAAVWASCRADVCGPNGVLKTPEQLVTLASIVERETGVPTERRQVAAVFVNRLKKGMRLQSDPTIIYGITKGEGQLGRGLKRSEIEARTAYNTYQIDGLPAGPIANPGVESLRAVANPDDVDYLYFVAAGPVPSDGHLFAATYKEHRANVAKYREIERQQAIAAEAEAEAAKDAIEAEQASEAGEDVPAGAAAPQ